MIRPKLDKSQFVKIEEELIFDLSSIVFFDQHLFLHDVGTLGLALVNIAVQKYKDP